MKTWLTENFQIKYPIIMAPMFLVSDVTMIKAAAKAGIMGCIPALNFKKIKNFETALKDLKKNCKGSFGINLIVNKSNIKLAEQLELLIKYPPSFVITSLGNPEETIVTLGKQDTKIFCDVVDLEHALKVEKIGADALIAVNSSAGGHLGNLPASLLIPKLQKNCSLPIISAGGVATSKGVLSTMALGVEGLSIGTPFIATNESPVSQNYKEAIVKYGSSDIVLTSKLSGTPCTVIKTQYILGIGLNQNFFERFLGRHKTLKRYIKILTYYRGMNLLKKAAFSTTYKTVWCAGPSLEFVDKIQSIQSLVDQLGDDLNDHLLALRRTIES